MGSAKNRVQKVLEDANIKLSSVATDIFGTSGREMLSASLQGESTPEEMAELAKGRLRKKIPALIEALRGNVSGHHRYMIEMSLRHLAYLGEFIADLDERIDKAMEPYREERELLTSITSRFKKGLSESIIAEIGVDMSQFPSEAHVVFGKIEVQRTAASLWAIALSLPRSRPYSLEHFLRRTTEKSCSEYVFQHMRLIMPGGWLTGQECCFWRRSNGATYPS
ncbi:MAG: hypothetical protein DDT29_00322 [Dehalococcoidia bacterium]|nr:hypothetical protein [Bacillota bacterium]